MSEQLPFRPGDRPLLIPIPAGLNTSQFFRWDPKPCSADCGYLSRGFMSYGGLKFNYCGVHEAEFKARIRAAMDADLAEIRANRQAELNWESEGGREGV